MTRFLVRPYTPDDRAVLHHIAAETAFFGGPVETFLDDRRLFCDAFYAYYTDLEPETSLVACVEQQIVGFIVGSVDTKHQQRQWSRKILPGMIWRALCRRYHLGRKTRGHIATLIRSSLHGAFPQADLATYPAHLHINIDRLWRGQGIGSRLIECYLDRLRALHVPGVHLHTTSHNKAACRLYVKVGFKLLDARPTRAWTKLVDVPVENRCYGLAPL